MDQPTMGGRKTDLDERDRLPSEAEDGRRCRQQLVSSGQVQTPDAAVVEHTSHSNGSKRSNPIIRRSSGALQPYAEQKRQATRVSLAERGASGGELKSRAGREMGGEALGAKRFQHGEKKARQTPGPLLALANCGALGKTARKIWGRRQSRDLRSAEQLRPPSVGLAAK
jgi:hypothetical protein